MSGGDSTWLTDEGEDENGDGKNAETILRIVFANCWFLVSEPGCLWGCVIIAKYFSGVNSLDIVTVVYFFNF